MLWLSDGIITDMSCGGRIDDIFGCNDHPKKSEEELDPSCFPMLKFSPHHELRTLHNSFDVLAGYRLVSNEKPAINQWMGVKLYAGPFVNSAREIDGVTVFLF